MSQSTAPSHPSRWLNLGAGASDLGVSPWTVQKLEWAGVLRRLRVSLPGGRDLRQLPFNHADLDRLIET
jgi:hypothetical protein